MNRRAFIRIDVKPKPNMDVFPRGERLWAMDVFVPDIRKIQQLFQHICLNVVCSENEIVRTARMWLKE